LLLPLGTPAEPPANAEGQLLFREQVRPLLTTKCLTCHEHDKKRSGLDLTRRASALAGGDTGAALKPGMARESLLFQRVQAREMPPKNPLSAEQVEIIRRWIDAGAPYEDEPLALRRAGPDWWSLQPVRRPAVPAIENRKSTIDNPIDNFICAKRQAAGLEGVPDADRRTFIRRATFDLTGLPPTPAEIDAFVNDPAPDAYDHLIDRLLASPAYGERWARHWLDVVRFGESHGYEMNNPRASAWPYRDYVIRAFNQDTPYPRMILEQLAGDTLADADTLVQSATGFLVGGATDKVGNAMPEMQQLQRMNDLDDMITTTGATFLGLTINCARCHDHKFDPLTQKDYYSLQAILAGVNHAERPIRAPVVSRPAQEMERLRRELTGVERLLDLYEPIAQPDAVEARRPAVNPCCNVERLRPVEARFVRMSIFATFDRSQPCVDELEVYTAEEEPRNVALASAGAKVRVSSTLPGFVIHKPEHVNDGRHGNPASWISNEPGKGVIEIELAKPARIERILWGRDREQRFRDRLAIDYTIEVAREPGRWTVIASSQDRRRYNPGDPPEPAIPPGLSPAQEERYRTLVDRRSRLLRQFPSETPTQSVYAGTFSQPGTTHVLLRGDPTRRGDSVTPAAPVVVRPSLSLSADAPEAQRRAALARWLGSADNPLTARVMVNRVWQYHFGQGLVSTPSDFGYNGSPPSHPELLDWLAGEFVRQGWQLRPLHRLIMTSATYRQSGRLDEKASAVDRHNRLLWRMMPRRLEAEAIRDSILTASGRLDRRMGGPGYYPWEPNSNYVTVYRPKLKPDPDDYRRMVYQWKIRSQQDATFGVFDCPDAATARPRRTSSTTVLQALNLLNGPLLTEQAELFAGRVGREAGEDAARQVERAFQLAFSRRPTGREAAASAALVQSHGLAALCRALYNANEFLYVD
jgi:hypothetical protein